MAPRLGSGLHGVPAPERDGSRDPSLPGGVVHEGLAAVLRAPQGARRITNYVHNKYYWAFIIFIYLFVCLLVLLFLVRCSFCCYYAAAADQLVWY